MMYNNQFAAAIKVDGQVLRENKDTVAIPFGSEYSVFIKNLGTTSAVAKIEIDGESITDGGVIVRPNDSVDIERFIRDLDEGNRFKFIEKTEAISDHRGDKAEDGLIRISLTREYDVSSLVIGGSVSGVDYGGQTPRSFTKSAHNSLSSTRRITDGGPTNMIGTASVGEVYMDASFNDAGITVPGSVSNQQFSEGRIGLLDRSTETVFVFKLVGKTNEDKPVELVTTKSKIQCTTCGKKNKSSSKFCSECGTSLNII